MSLLIRLAPVLLTLAACTSPSVPYTQPEDPPFAVTQFDVETGAQTRANANNDKTRDTFQLLLGSRSLSEDQDWDPLDRQYSLGGEWTWLHEDFPIGFETGLGFSYDKDGDVKAGTGELYAGVRWDTDLFDSPLRFYVGAGPSLIYARWIVDAPSTSMSDWDYSIGLYGHLGLTFDFDLWHVGVDVRTLQFTHVTLYNYPSNADYVQVALVAGWHW